MKILFTGGGTGGHFYPIIAVTEAIEDLVRVQKLIDPQLYYAAPTSYDSEMLVAHNITFVHINAGKLRRYFSLLNIFDLIKTAWGIICSLFTIFFIYPDVIFSKGGYASFPTLLAARLFDIPVIIHESDAVPGKVNLWAGTFAKKIAVSYPEAAAFFPKEKVAYTGNPIRKSSRLPEKEGALEFLKLQPTLPVLLVLGGSQGAIALNEAILSSLPQLVTSYQIIHQTGSANITDIEGRARLILEGSAYANRYKPFAYLNDLALRMSAGITSLVISRAGSTIFEIATWGVPSIIIPLPGAAEDHQTKNAFSYAIAGACSVIEQNNLNESVLLSEIKRILGDTALSHKMSEGAKKFSRTDAAELIASALIDVGLSHES